MRFRINIQKRTAPPRHRALRHPDHVGDLCGGLFFSLRSASIHMCIWEGRFVADAPLDLSAVQMQSRGAWQNSGSRLPKRCKEVKTMLISCGKGVGRGSDFSSIFHHVPTIPTPTHTIPAIPIIPTIVL